MFSINWGCTLTDYLTTWAGLPVNGLASKYLLSYINNNYDLNSRMLIAYFRLTPRDIADFNFNNRIQLNGDQYIVNSIKGYPVSSGGICKVELLKTYGNFGVDIPPPACPTDIQVAISVTGTVVNVTGGVSNLTQACCNSLGFNYNADVGRCFTTPLFDVPPHPTPNTFENDKVIEILGSGNIGTITSGIVKGNNNVLTSSGIDITVFGNNNTIKGLSNKIRITGDDNILEPRSEDVTIIGNNNTVRAVQDSRIQNGEVLNYSRTISGVNITGDYGLALNNKEQIIAKGTSTGINQVSTTVKEVTVLQNKNTVFIGQGEAFYTLPTTTTYNSTLGEQSLRLPNNCQNNINVKIKATAQSGTEVINNEYWEFEANMRVISNKGSLILQRTQVKDDESTLFTGSKFDIYNTSNIPYIYNGYLLFITLPTIGVETKFIITTTVTSVSLSGTAITDVIPTDISDLVGWFDASNLNSLTFDDVIGSGEEITAWADISGNGYSVSQTNTSMFPVWYNDDGRGRPYLDFDGSSANLRTTTSALADLAQANNTVIAVFDSDTVTDEFYGQIIVGTSSSGGFPYLNLVVNVSNLGGGGDDSVSYSSRNNLVSTTYSNKITSAKINFPSAIIGRRNGTTVDILDSRGNTNSQTLGASTTAAVTFNISGRTNSSGSDFNEFNGKLYEVIVFNRAITDTEREQLMNYLRNKWSIDNIATAPS